MYVSVAQRWGVCVVADQGNREARRDSNVEVKRDMRPAKYWVGTKGYHGSIMESMARECRLVTGRQSQELQILSEQVASH